MRAPARLMLWWRVFAGCACAGLASVAPHAWAGSTPSDPGAAERGRLALLQHSYLKAEWKIAAYRNAWKLWGTPAPDPEKDPDGYARDFLLLANNSQIVITCRCITVNVRSEFTDKMLVAPSKLSFGG
jgi:hypothetical protein